MNYEFWASFASTLLGGAGYKMRAPRTRGINPAPPLSSGVWGQLRRSNSRAIEMLGVIFVGGRQP